MSNLQQYFYNLLARYSQPPSQPAQYDTSPETARCPTAWTSTTPRTGAESPRWACLSKRPVKWPVHCQPVYQPRQPTRAGRAATPLKQHPQLLANVSDNPADWAWKPTDGGQPQPGGQVGRQEKLFVMDTAHGIGGVLANEGGDELFETAALHVLHHVGLINDVQLAQIVAYNPAKYALKRIMWADSTGHGFS
ncbi:MAG: hypothetical protein R2857_05180 [Vampirovibrionales bacterium]